MARPFAHTLFSPAAVARFVITTAVGLGLDLWTKSLAVRDLSPSLFDPNPKHVVIPGWLQFEYVSNPGAVFGIAPGQRGVFLVVSAVAIGFLSYLFAGSGKRPVYQVILGLLLAGVLGNLYDRIMFAHVRDMIHALPGFYWPASLRGKLPFLPKEGLFPYIFNVADSLLCVGVVLMLIYSFFNAPEEKPRRSSPTARAAA